MREEIKKERMSLLRDRFDKCDILHFSPEEVVKHNSEKWPFDRIFPPPTRLSDNIIRTVQIADEIRDAWGGPVIVYSGYRAPAYNELISGAENSQHMFFRALDIAPANGNIGEFFDLCDEIVSDFRSSGWFVGYGKYYKSKFVHIDTSDVNGKPYGYQRNWDDRRG